MPANIIKRIGITLTTLLLAIATTLTSSVVYYNVHPQIGQLSTQTLEKGPFCNLPSYGIGPPPGHILGFPIPFESKYAAGGCGWQSVTPSIYFYIDILVWLVFIVIIFKLIRVLRNRK